MSKVIKLIIGVIVVTLMMLVMISPIFRYIFRGIPKNINETWEHYIVSTDAKSNSFSIITNNSQIKVYKNNDDINIKLDKRVCSFSYRNTGPYHCVEIPNWVIYFDKYFEALVIEEYPIDVDTRDGMYSGLPIYHLAVSDNKLFFKEEDSTIIDLTKKISQTAKVEFED